MREKNTSTITNNTISVFIIIKYNTLFVVLNESKKKVPIVGSRGISKKLNPDYTDYKDLKRVHICKCILPKTYIYALKTEL